jgi:hypothetical protein
MEREEMVLGLSEKERSTEWRDGILPASHHMLAK